MHRFHLPPEQCARDEMTLTGREAHHGLHVLRLRPGELVVVFDGAGRQYECEAIEVGRQRLRLRVRRCLAAPPLPYQLTLLQALPKGKTFDLIVQKATELGASRLIPLLSERVVSRPQADRSEHKAEHWRLVAVEAAKQCGAAWLPQVEPPRSPRDVLLRGERFDLTLLASLRGDRRHPREYFHAFRRDHGRSPASVAVWVGPEGDFSDAEIEAIQSAGARPISLGPLVLRVETAAIYCLSVLNYELQSPTGV
jgi:16S rRNA (uracil1498-N3)-methyltransferase